MKQYSFVTEGPGLEAIKKFAMNNQKSTGAIVGGTAGALTGAVTGMKKDENGKRHILRNAAIGAGAGAGVGAATVAGAQKYAANKYFNQNSAEFKKNYKQNAKNIADAMTGNGIRGAAQQGIKDDVRQMAVFGARQDAVNGGGTVRRWLLHNKV